MDCSTGICGGNELVSLGCLGGTNGAYVYTVVKIAPVTRSVGFDRGCLGEPCRVTTIPIDRISEILLKGDAHTVEADISVQDGGSVIVIVAAIERCASGSLKRGELRERV